MKEINPPAPPAQQGWEPISIGFCHIEKNGDLIVKETVMENFVGTRRLYRNISDRTIIYFEYDFFIKGIVLKRWGFEDDVKEGNGQLALFYSGKWYLKEIDDEFERISSFDKHGKVVKITFRLSNKEKVIEIARTSLN